MERKLYINLKGDDTILQTVATFDDNYDDNDNENRLKVGVVEDQPLCEYLKTRHNKEIKLFVFIDLGEGECLYTIKGAIFFLKGGVLSFRFRRFLYPSDKDKVLIRNMKILDIINEQD
jgi:hypothetical protein